MLRPIAFLLGLLTLTPVEAAYPDRTITIICASGAGGFVDVTTRVMADHLSKKLGQPVVVQNEPGGGSTIAISNAAKATPDGYTLLSVGSGVAVARELYPNSKIDVLRDLAPVSLLGAAPLVLFVHNSVPANDYATLIAWLKAHPDEATTGSNGRGSAGHLAIEIFKKMAGVKIRYIPYKTTPQVHADLIGGRLSLMMTSSLGDPGKFGMLTAIGVTTLERWNVMPDVPTFDELGLKGLEATTWIGLFAPKDAPAEIVEALAAAVDKSLTDPTLRERYDRIGIIPPRRTGTAFTEQYVKREITKWSEILRNSADRP